MDFYYNYVEPMSMETTEESYIHTNYVVFPNMKVTRNTYWNGRQTDCEEAGEYVYFESHQTHLYVNREQSADSPYALNNVTMNYLPSMPCFRAHTPVYGPWPEKCRGDYLLKFKNDLLYKLKQVADDRLFEDMEPESLDS